MRQDATLPTWMFFPIIFSALYLSHITLLRLPYYWDEAGYYIPAAWDFYRTGSLIPVTTLSNAHPPLPSIYLALCWKVAGFTPEVTREAILLVAAFAILAVWRLAQRLFAVPAVAFWTATLTALYPIWFAQSTLAHADIFAAACTLWGLVYALPPGKRNPYLACIWFTLAVLCKETAICVPAALALYRAAEGLRMPARPRRRNLSESAWLLASALPLAGWYAWHFARTGFLFGNPEFLRYNAQATLTPLRFLAAFVHRLLHLTAHMNLFVPVSMALATLLLPVRNMQEGAARLELHGKVLFPILWLLLANALFFSILGGALLTRYLLPMYPLVILLAVVLLYQRAPAWHALAALAAAAFVIGIFVNPPYGFAPEDNLQYARITRMEMAAIARLAAQYPGATVASAWPVTDALTRPELGYVTRPFHVYALEDFTAAQINRAVANRSRFTMALVFSTKYDPPSPLFTLGPRSRQLDERYFGLHEDLPPEDIATRLGGSLIWKRTDQGMGVALIRMNSQPQTATDSPPPSSTSLRISSAHHL
ncbi:MAG: glycosyltransferase family 39 protein [Acidobacteriota bacterium]|nr:glycosyltransferase family 39 protein [Acidobacteriota bacterium]